MITVWLARGVEARSLAGRAVAEHLGVPEDVVRLGREPLGRPTILGVDDLHLSISHSHDVAAVALTEAGPVGIDVEVTRELPSADLARRWFGVEEAERVARRPEEFLHLWTRKEAVGKARGVGLRGGGLRRRMPPPQALPGMTPVPGLPGVGVTSFGRGTEIVAVACVAPGVFDGHGLPAPLSVRTVSDPAT